MCWVWAARGHLPGSAAGFAFTKTCFAFTGSCRLLLHLCALQLPRPLAGEMKVRPRAVRALQHPDFTEAIPTRTLWEQLGGLQGRCQRQQLSHIPGGPGQVRWEAADEVTLSQAALRADKTHSPQSPLELTAEGSPWCLLQSVPTRAVPPVFAFPKFPRAGHVSTVTPSDPMRALCRAAVPVLSPCRALQQIWLRTPEAGVVGR